MSHFYVINIEGLCCPLYSWYPAHYQNGFHLPHRPLVHFNSADCFCLLPGHYINLPYIHTTNFTRSCHIVMSICHVILSHTHTHSAVTISCNNVAPTISSTILLLQQFTISCSLTLIQTKYEITWIIYM